MLTTLRVLILMGLCGCTCRSAPPTNPGLTCPQDFLSQSLRVCQYGLPYAETTPAVVARICSHVPANSGACSVACDPIRLHAFLPDSSVGGGCATFRCGTTDGLLFFAGGCD